MACITRPTRRRRSPAPSAATSPRTAGGVHCLKYGLTVHNVVGLKFLTADGELITLGGRALDAQGYDLLALMTGSEGMLGVMVEITVKLLPKPERAQVVLAAFGNIEQAGNAVAAIIASGCTPAGLEMMDNPAIRAAEDYVKVGYPVEAAAILLCELDGTNEEVSEGIARVRELLLRQGATEVRTAKDEGRTPQNVGQDARRLFPPSAASRPTTTAWTAPSRAGTSPRC